MTTRLKIKYEKHSADTEMIDIIKKLLAMAGIDYEEYEVL